MSDAPITVEDIWTGLWDLRRARLVVLSACETGVVDVHSEALSEMPGLPGALLLSGVPTVVGTLWPVDDVAAALVMGKFYSNHIVDGLDIPSALKNAQNWLRDVTLAEIETTASVMGRAFEQQAQALRTDLSLRASAAIGKIQPFRHPYFWAPYVCFGL